MKNMFKIPADLYRAWLRHKNSSKSKYTPHQGANECARRRGETGWRARKTNK